MSNDISLCKLRHAPFDAFISSITPNRVCRVREDVLREAGGPMLLRGLQGLDKQRIELPGTKGALPNKELLEKWFEKFRKAGYLVLLDGQATQCYEPAAQEDAFLRRISEMRSVLRDFSVTCEAIVSRGIVSQYSMGNIRCQ